MSAPLCFLFAKCGKLSKNDLKSVFMEFYNVPVSNAAKEKLHFDIASLNTELVSRVPPLKRRAGANQHAAIVDDLFSLLTFVDENKLKELLPVYVCSNPDEMPTLRLLEGDLHHLLLKLDKFDKRLETVFDRLLALSGKMVAMSTKVDRIATRVDFGPVSTQATCIGGSGAQVSDDRHGLGLSTPGSLSVPVAGPVPSPSYVHVDSDYTSHWPLPGQSAAPADANATFIVSGHGSMTSSATATATATTQSWADASTVSQQRVYGGDGGDGGCCTHGEGDDEGEGSFEEVPRRSRRKRARQGSRENQFSYANVVVDSVSTSAPLSRPMAASVPVSGSGRSSGLAMSGPHGQLNIPARNVYARGATGSSVAVGLPNRPSGVNIATAVQVRDSRRSRPLIRGRATHDQSGLISAVRPTRVSKKVFCIDNVGKDVSWEDMAYFLDKVLTVRMITLFKVQSRRRWDDANFEDRSAYRVCIPSSDVDKLLQENLWPSGIAISEWYFRPVDKSNGNNFRLSHNSEYAEDAANSGFRDADEHRRLAESAARAAVELLGPRSDGGASSTSIPPTLFSSSDVMASSNSLVHTGVTADGEVLPDCEPSSVISVSATAADFPSLSASKSADVSASVSHCSSDDAELVRHDTDSISLSDLSNSTVVATVTPAGPAVAEGADSPGLSDQLAPIEGMDLAGPDAESTVIYDNNAVS